MNKLISTFALSAMLTAGLTGIAAAQTGATTTGTNPPPAETAPAGGATQPQQQQQTPQGPMEPAARTPGAPNTGAGGDASANIALLSLSVLAGIGAIAYLARARRS